MAIDNELRSVQLIVIPSDIMQPGIEKTGAAIGLSAPYVGKLLGFVSLTSVGSTIVLSIVGAVVGFYVTRLLNRLHNRKKKKQ